MAGIFAAKEALMKALGCGLASGELKDIRVLHDPAGAPYYALQGEYARIAEEKGPGALYDMLRALDPQSAASIPENNVKRVARALEFLHDTGIRMSEHNARERMKESPFDYRYFVLYTDRERLYERIDARVLGMLENGLLDEVRALRSRGMTEDLTSMHAIGYRQLLRYLDGRYSYEEAVEEIQRETRRYAKRQLTWFRREKNARFTDVEKEDLIDVYKTWNLA